ncbi:hypothetical protein GMLC_39500 [Geomonas limicola]|uniref:Uncharacterized protein n=1 Tax=Geomonas limicola TaxID=2740186 RepID=A0A6V8NCW5_9BACT|nr:hypothetical protein [Geomonas limicola]GFO70371.1 hypothetical protein GMLC_39500 [Geomonas limicola]
MSRTFSIQNRSDRELLAQQISRQFEEAGKSEHLPDPTRFLSYLNVALENRSPTLLLSYLTWCQGSATDPSGGFLRAIELLRDTLASALEPAQAPAAGNCIDLVLRCAGPATGGRHLLSSGRVPALRPGPALPRRAPGR